MIIILNGTPGSGKSTIAKMMQERLGYKRFYAGALFRKEARKREMPFNEFLIEIQKDDKFDLWVDNQLVDMAKKEKDVVIESRVGTKFLPDAINIFLKVDISEGARRTVKDKLNNKREEETATTVKEKEQEIAQRLKQDQLRYKKHYNIDILDESKYNLVIDSTNKTIEEVYKQIMDFINKSN